jgi:hypothetical protein
VAKVVRVAALQARASQASGGGHHSLVLSQVRGEHTVVSTQW